MNDDVNEVRGFSYISIEKVETSDPFSTGFTYYAHGTRVVAVSPDGKWIAFGGWDETIQVCELVEGGRSLTYRGHKDHVCAMEWSPDGTFIASASSGEATADIQIWEATTGQVVSLSRSDEEGVISLAWSRWVRWERAGVACQRRDQHLSLSWPFWWRECRRVVAGRNVYRVGW